MNQPTPTPYLLTGHGLLYILQRVVPLILFGLLSGVALLIQRGGLDTSALSDRVLFDLAVADCLRDNFILGLHENMAIPCSSHTLWQVIVSIIGWLVPNLLHAALLLNAAMAVAVVWQSIRLAEKFLDHPIFVLCCGSVVAVSLPTVGSLLSQGPELLATALILTAFRLHVSGIIGDKPVMPVRGAMCIGLAMLVHIEFGIIWLALSLHALLLASGKSPRFSTVTVLLRSFIGGAVFALIVWPAVHKNVRVTGMPWPASAEQLIQGNSGIDGQFADLDAEADSGVASSLKGTVTELIMIDGPLASIFLLLAVLGIIFMGTQFARRERSQAFLVIGFLLVVVPLMLILLGTGTHPGKTAAVLGSLYPALVIAGVYAFYHIGARTSRKSAMVLALAGAGLWILLSVIASVQEATRNHAELTHQLTLRESLSEWQKRFITNNGRLQVITDAPGWLSYSKSADISLDLMGWANPHCLKHCIAEDGQIDADKLRQEIGKLSPRPQALILWTSAGHQLGKQLKASWGKNIISASGGEGQPTILVIPRPRS